MSIYSLYIGSWCLVKILLFSFIQFMHVIIIILKFATSCWYIWTLQLKANGESFLLCASWSINSGYKRRIWTIWEGTSAGMPLHAMVPWKTTCWSSLSSATATGSSLWDQDKGFLLSGTSTLTKSFLSHFMLFNCCEYFLAWASFNFYQVYLVAIIVLCYFECFKFIVSKRVVLLLEVERDLEKQ